MLLVFFSIYIYFVPQADGCGAGADGGGVRASADAAAGITAVYAGQGGV